MITSVKLIAAIVTVLMSVVCSSVARAQWQPSSSPWTAVGASGITTDLKNVVFNQDGSVSVAPDVPQARVTLRYNITAVSGILLGTPTITLSARYQADGPGSYVLIRVKRVDLDQDLEEQTIATFDSTRFARAAGFQNNKLTFCRTFNFIERTGGGMNAYYLEVNLIKKHPRSNVAFAAVTIYSEDRLC